MNEVSKALKPILDYALTANRSGQPAGSSTVIKLNHYAALSSMDLPAPSLVYAIIYPNPALGSEARRHIDLQRTSGGAVASKVQAVLVDRNYRVMSKIDPTDVVFGLDITFNYAARGLSTNELYRLYYVVYNANGIVIKGHGDVRYSPQ